jgi:hypothetical protein
VITSASYPLLSIFLVELPHYEVTIIRYVDVVASAPLTILKVSNMDDTIRVYVNASAVQFVFFFELAKQSIMISFYILSAW